MNNFKQKLSAAVHGRNLPSATVTVIIIVSVILLNMILYTIGSNYPMYLRFDEEPDMSVSDASDENFAAAQARGEKVTVTFCMYRDDVKKHTTGQYVLDTAEQFAKKYPEFIEIKYINIITQLDSEGNTIDVDLYKSFAEANEVTLSRYSVIFECGNKMKVLTDTYSGLGYADFFTFDSAGNATSYSGEEMFASMVNFVIREGETKYAYFTTGHSEMPSLNLYNLLTKAGYVVKEINLRKVDKIPDNAGLVIISNPLSDFERAAEGSNLYSEIERLRAYADRGGNFLVTLDPYASKTPVLESFLSEFGFTLNRTDKGEAHILKDDTNGITTDGFTLIASYADDEICSAVKAKTDISGGNIILSNVGTLGLSGSAKALLVSSDSAVAEAAGSSVSAAGVHVIAGYSENEREGGAVASMVVMPSVYLTAADAIVTNGYANKDFIYALCETFYECYGMVYGANNYVYDDAVLENLTMSTARIYTAIAVAIPVILTATGAVIVIRRKNR